PRRDRGEPVPAARLAAPRCAPAGRPAPRPRPRRSAQARRRAAAGRVARPARARPRFAPRARHAAPAPAIRRRAPPARLHQAGTVSADPRQPVGHFSAEAIPGRNSTGPAESSEAGIPNPTKEDPMTRTFHLAIAAAATAIALAVAASAPAARAPKTVQGSVGPGFTITLTLGGKKVTTLKKGVPYRFAINDRASIHDFHLMGPGINRVL